VNDKDQIIYGLGAIKGVGEGPVDAIVEARKTGEPFTDLFNFCERIDSKKVNKRAIEALIKAGALDSIGPNRDIMLAAMADAVKAAEQSAQNEAAGMMDLFGSLEAEEDKNPYEAYQNVAEATLKVRLAGEKDTLGLYLTGHPIDEFEDEVRQVVSLRLGDLDASVEELKRARRGNMKTVAGLILGVRTRQTQRGDTMAIVTLDDRTGRLEMTLFGDAYDEFKTMLVPDTVVVVEAEAGWDDYNDRPRIRAQRIYSLADARQALIKGIEFTVTTDQQDQFKKRLQQVIKHDLPEDQGCRIWIHYTNDRANGVISLGDQHRILLEDDMLHQLKATFGEENYKFRY
jgi:DNA polymerase-3 subunit alpha